MKCYFNSINRNKFHNLSVIKNDKLDWSYIAIKVIICKKYLLAHENFINNARNVNSVR